MIFSRVTRVFAVLGCVCSVVWSSCDHGLPSDPEGPAGISGRLSFRGDWPPNIAQVAVAVYQDAPSTVDDFFTLAGSDTDTPLGVSAYDYLVPVQRAGVYRWIVVAWREEDSFWNFNSLLGCYHLTGATLPTAVEVERGEITEEIDIDIDFATLQEENAAGTDVCRNALPAALLEQLAAGE